MPLLTLIRHGESTYNVENRFTGNVNVPLTTLGEAEAKAAGAKLIAFKYNAAFTSMLVRAQESLKIILEEIHQSNIPVIKNAALNERMYGILQGLNKAEVANRYGNKQVEIWRRSFAVRPPGGESLQDTFNRTVPYYAKYIEPLLKAGENILIVAHGNSLRALMMDLENINSDAIERVNIPTGTPRHYVLDKDLKIITVVNL